MNTTKRQTTIRVALQRICDDSSMSSISELAPRLRCKRVDDRMLRMLIQDEPLEAAKLEILEAVVSELEAAQGPVKQLLTKAASLGHTQVRIAAMIEVSPVTLSRWASGRFAPSPENLERLTAVVNGLESGSPTPA